MLKLNKDIEKFWTDRGYTIRKEKYPAVIEPFNGAIAPYYLYWYADTYDNYSKIIALSDIIFSSKKEDAATMTYCLSKEISGNEKYIVKLIKMKAFI
jgi:hypothetical protein